MAINPKNVQWDSAPSMSNVQWDVAEPQDFSVPTQENLTRRRPASSVQQPTTLAGLATGGAETLATLGTGTLASGLGTAKGIIESIGAGQYGTPQGVRTAEDVASKFAEQYTYQPRTQTGQQMAESLGNIASESKVAGLAGMPLIGATTPLLPRAEATLKTLTRKVQNVPRDKMLKEAQNIGLVAPPSQAGAGALPRAAEIASGKFMMNDAMSAKNSQVINDAARKYIGLPTDSPLSTETLADLKMQYSAPYDVASRLQPTQIASSAGGLVKSTITRAGDEIVNDIKLAKEDANIAYRAWKNPSNPNRTEAKNDYFSLTKQVKQYESELERLAKANNNPELLNDLKNARQKIAKVYTVENALNPETGTVDIRQISKQDAPLTGELALAQRFGKAFPDVTKPVKTQPNALSIYDLLAISAGAGGETTNKALIGLPFLRAAGRSAIMSEPVQKRMVTPRYPTPAGVNVFQGGQQAMPLLPYAGLLNYPNEEQ
jgi:ribosomal protein L29